MTTRSEAVVIEAAIEWVEHATGAGASHPNLWANDADFALIAAVRALCYSSPSATTPNEPASPLPDAKGHPKPCPTCGSAVCPVWLRQKGRA